MSGRRKSSRLVPGSFLVLLVVVVAAGSRSPDPVRQARRLPDGTVYVLEKVTRGPDHVFQTGGGLGQLLARVLPQAARSATGLEARYLGHLDPGVPVAWFTVRSAPAASASAALPEWTVYDEDGCETQIFDWTVVDHGIVRFALPAIPRHGTRAGLRIYQEAANRAAQPVAQFRLPSLGAATAAAGKEQPLPVTVHNQEVDYTLERFVTGADLTSPDRAPGDATRASTHLEITARRSGKPETDWVPVALEFRDSSGSRISTPLTGYVSQRGNRAHLRAGRNLFVGEKTWRVQVEFARTADAHFRQEELVTLRVPVPTPEGVKGSRSERPQQKTVNGMSLDCRGLTWTSFGPPYAVLRAGLLGRPLAGARVTLLTVRDDAGRLSSLLPGEDAGIQEVDSVIHQSVEFGFKLKIPEQSKWVDVTLAVQRTRTVEFLASPTRPSQVRLRSSARRP